MNAPIHPGFVILIGAGFLCRTSNTDRFVSQDRRKLTGEGLYLTREDAQKELDAYERQWCGFGFLPGTAEPVIRPLAEVLFPAAWLEDERAEVEALHRDEVAA